MSPISLPRAPSFSVGGRAASSSLSTRSMTPSSTLLKRAAEAAGSEFAPPAVLTRAISHIKRQSGGIIAIPTTYAGLNAGPAPGTVAGIVLGSVAGFILILYLIYTAFQLSGGRRTIIDEEVIRRRSVSRSRSPPRRTRRRSHSAVSEVVEVRERQRPRSETIVVEERTRSRPPPEDDIIEVIEEHSPPRRKSRRESGFRTVDPGEFGGGGRPMRKVRR